MYGNSGKDLLLVLKWREKLLQYLLNICTFSSTQTLNTTTDNANNSLLLDRVKIIQLLLDNSQFSNLHQTDKKMRQQPFTFIWNISNFQNCQNSLSNKSNSGPSIQAAWAAAFIIYHGMNNWTAHCCLQLQEPWKSGNLIRTEKEYKLALVPIRNNGSFRCAGF